MCCRDFILRPESVIPVNEVLTCPGSDLSTTAAEQRTARTGERTVLARDVNLDHTRNANWMNCGANMSKCRVSTFTRWSGILPGLSSVFLPGVQVSSAYADGSTYLAGA